MRASHLAGNSRIPRNLPRITLLQLDLGHNSQLTKSRLFRTNSAPFSKHAISDFDRDSHRDWRTVSLLSRLKLSVLDRLDCLRGQAKKEVIDEDAWFFFGSVCIANFLRRVRLQYFEICFVGGMQDGVERLATCLGC